jgi:hypothetical protein
VLIRSEFRNWRAAALVEARVCPAIGIVAQYVAHEFSQVRLMLLQTNSYIVPKDKRSEHSRLVARFKQVLARIGCDHFEAYEQVGSNWSGDSTGRFVQIMRFRDRKHQQAVQAAERTDPGAQALIKEFCELINFPYQQQQGLFAVGFYTSLLQANTRIPPAPPAVESRSHETVAATPDNGDASSVAAPEAVASAELGLEDEPPLDEPNLKVGQTTHESD